MDRLVPRIILDEVGIGIDLALEGIIMDHIMFRLGMNGL